MGRSQLICTGGILMVTVQYSNDYKDDKNEALHTQDIFRTDVPHGGPAFHAAGTAPRSLPVNIPDWSKILGQEYKNDDIRDKEDVDEENRIPPHEYLARTRVASFSVQEGMGRTLKGRDLSRVRNAVWKQTGFED
ncbi:hypothetical protein CQW23_24148 [Capsicum baccatum]|uniref:Senescence regulator S40 n=1 Tax=Capsicum baccatum TaxID=33114 RepID=A0A2G2VTZ4_CAPBA|nr:hypothetical protein CQW23_24148 [Capsicum baccatum]